MDKLTSEIIKNQMIGQTSGHMSNIPNSPVVFSMFETFYNISRTSAGGMYEWNDAFKVFITELNEALKDDENE